MTTFKGFFLIITDFVDIFLINFNYIQYAKPQSISLFFD